MYSPLDGVSIRQGKHLEWFRAGEMRFDQGEEEAAFVWSDSRTGYRGVYLQIVRKDGTFAFGPDGLQVVAAYKRQEDPQCWPCSDGGWFIAWEDFAVDEMGDIYCTKIDRNGNLLWQGNDDHLVPICTYPKTQEDVRITDDLNGGCIIAWRDLREGNADIYAMHVLGNGTVDPAWTSNGKPVVVAPGSQALHTADRDDAGGMIIAWQDGRIDRNTDIRAQRISPSGELLWGGGEGIQVCADPANQATPKLCPDGVGGAFICWADERNFENTHRDIYVQRVNAAGNPLWTKDGVPVCDADKEQLANRIILSAPGEAIVSWDDKRNAPVGLNVTDIYAMRISGDDAVEKKWAMPQGMPVCANPANQTNTRMIGDGSGGAFFVWEDERDGGFPEVDLWAQRIGVNGSPAWAVDGIPFIKYPGLQISPIVRRLSDGSAAVVWGDYRSGSLSLYAQKLNPQDGSTLYDDLGKLIVAGLDGNAVDPTILPDGKGAATLVYLDGRQGGQGFVPYVQKIVNTGASLDYRFANQGEPAIILDRAGGAAVPASVTDGDGNLFIVWEDHRADQNYSIYAQKVAPDGAMQWGNMGVRVANYLSDISEQKTPWVISDGSGGIIVAFNESTDELYNNIFV